MAFKYDDPTSWQDIEDDALLAHVKGIRFDIIAAVQNEILRRNMTRMTAAQAVEDGRRARSEFLFAVWTTAISLCLAVAGVWMTWKINSDAIAREDSRAMRRLYPAPVMGPRNGGVQ